MQKTFKPTTQQIEAAQHLFICMAFYQTVKPVFEEMEKNLLSTREYHYDERYYTDEWKKRGFNYPEDRVLTDITDVCQMAGLQTSEGDSVRYYAELRKRALYNGFLDGENTDSKASYEVIKAENAFIEATEAVHYLKLDDIVMQDHRKKLLELLSNLYAPLINDADKDKASLKYYDERVGLGFVEKG